MCSDLVRNHKKQAEMPCSRNQYYPVTKCRGFLKNAATNMAKALGLQASRSKVENYLFVRPNLDLHVGHGLRHRYHERADVSADVEDHRALAGMGILVVHVHGGGGHGDVVPGIVW